MVRVSIDVGALRGVVTSIGTFATTATSWSSTVSGDASAALTSAPSLAGVAAQVTQAQDAATALSDRVDLAILVNGGDDDFNGTVSYDIPYDTASYTRRMIGEQLAVLFKDLPDGASAEDLERLGDLAAILGRHSEDDWVLGNMFEDLGPEGTLAVAQRLNDVYENWDEHPATGDDTWPDAPDGSDQHLTEYIRDLQQSFMSTFGNSLANATNGSYLPSDFGTQLAQYATENRGENPWALSQTLRFGTYDADFLTDVGDRLYEFEKEEGQYGPVWGPMMGDDRPTLGTSTQDGYYDPFVGLFSAMGRTPEAGLNFFASPGQSTERVDYFVGERTFQPDGGNTLFEALDAATTTYREPSSLESDRAAWLMSQTVDELADRDEGRNDRAIPDGAKDSLGHMFATYIADVDRIAQGEDDGGPGINDPGDYQAWMNGLPTGANFSRDDLNDVLREVLTDKEAVEQIGNASAQYNGFRIGSAVDEYQGPPDGDTAQVRAVLQNSSTLNGYILGNMEVGTEGAAKEADDRAKMYTELAGDVVGLVPLPGQNFTGEFVSFLADQAINQGKDFAQGEFADNLSSVNSENHSIQQVAITDQQIAVVTAMQDHLPEEATTDANGNTYPWFTGGSLQDPSTMSPEMRNDFIGWLDSGEGGDFVTQLLPDMSASFAEGIERANATES